MELFGKEITGQHLRSVTEVGLIFFSSLAGANTFIDNTDSSLESSRARSIAYEICHTEIQYSLAQEPQETYLVPGDCQGLPYVPAQSPLVSGVSSELFVEEVTAERLANIDRVAVSNAVRFDKFADNQQEQELLLTAGFGLLLGGSLTYVWSKARKEPDPTLALPWS